MTSRGCGCSLASEQDKRELAVSPVYVRSSATSLDGTVRLELFSFSADAGRHTLRVVGLEPTRDYGRNRVVIARRSRAQLAARIVALVFAGIVTLGSIVASSLLIAARR